MRHKSLIITALTTCSIAILCNSCKKEQEKAPTEAPQITVFPIIKQAVAEKESWFSYLAGKDATPIQPHIQGYIKAQEYKNGASVKKGDVLFRIEEDLYLAQLNQAKANLKEAEATHTAAIASEKQATLDVERFTPLVKQGAIPEKTLLDAKETLNAAKANIEKSEAQIAQTKAAVNSAQINLDYCTITAPFDGIAGTATTSIGELVDSSNILTTIISVNPIDLDMSVPSNLVLSDFNRGDGLSKPTTPPQFDISLEDGSTYPYKGTIRTIDSKVDANGIVHLKGRVNNPNHKLRPGFPVRTSITLKNYDAFLVSPLAIQETLRNKFIIVLDKQGKPIMVPVEIIGNYEVEVDESNGYKSSQNMLSVKGISKGLEESFKSIGYDNPTEVPVVTDALNGMLAATISANNSRLEEGANLGTVSPISFTFKPAPTLVESKMKEKMADKNKAETGTQAPSLPPIPVKVLPLIQQDIAVEEEWQGYLRGIEETQIRAKVTGFLAEQCFTDGGMVNKGDVLFKLDPAPFQAELDKAEANLDMALANEKLAVANNNKAKQDLNIYQKLEKESPGAISEKSITDALTALETTAAALQEAQAAILQRTAERDTAKINLGYTTITAPFTGLTSISNPSAGQLIRANDPTALVSISSVDPIRVDFAVSGLTALDALTKTTKSGNITGSQLTNFDVILENGKKYPQQGIMISSDNVINTDTGTLPIVGHIDNKDGILRTGMPVRVKSTIATEAASFIVPVRAPITVGTTDMIILVAEDKAPTLLPIKKGITALVEINEGDGKLVKQPMQQIAVDDELLTGLLLATEQAQNLEEIIFKLEEVSSWSELAAKKAGSNDFKQLVEEKNKRLNADEQMKAEDEKAWEELFYNSNGVIDAKSYVLNHEGVESEGELISAIKGYSDPLVLALETIGFSDPSKVQVVVEGSITAMRSAQANEAGKTRANKLAPTPYHYDIPKTVVPSITSDKQ